MAARSVPSGPAASALLVGKNDPARSLGIDSATSPALVVNSRGREPLRSVTPVSVRSYLAAPITSAASASIKS